MKMISKLAWMLGVTIISAVANAGYNYAVAATVDFNLLSQPGWWSVLGWQILGRALIDVFLLLREVPKMFKAYIDETPDQSE